MSQAPFLYRCRILGGGTQCFSKAVHPNLIEPWARSQGLVAVPGSLNVCADRDVQLPETYISLLQYAPERIRPNQPEFDPRLYAALLNGTVQVWVFRWSDLQHLDRFARDADGCPRRRRCELVAQIRLRETLALQEGDNVTLRFQV